MSTRKTTAKARTKKRRGRPAERVIKLDATPERVARAMFSAVKRPDPAKRKAAAAR